MLQSYCWDAFGRVIRVMKAEELSQVLPHILPPLLASASDDSCIALLEQDEDDVEDESGLGADENDAAAGGGGGGGGGGGRSGRGGRAGGDDDDEEEDDGDFIECVDLENGGKLAQVRTSALEERQSATEALSTLFHHSFGSAADKARLLQPFAPRVLEVALRTLVGEKTQAVVFNELRTASIIMVEDLVAVLAGGLSVAAVGEAFTPFEAAAMTGLAAGAAAAAGGANEAAQAAAAESAEAAATVAAAPSEARQFLAIVDQTMLVLEKQLGRNLQLDAEITDDEEDQYTVLNTALIALKNSIVSACSRTYFAGEAAPMSAAAGAVPTEHRFLPLLRPQRLESLTKALLQVHQDAVQRRGVRAAERTVSGSAGDLDEDAVARLGDQDDEDDQVRHQALDVIGMLLRTHRARYARIFSLLVAPKLEMWASEACPTSDRLAAVLLADDVLEFAGDDAADARPDAGGRSLADRYLPLLLAEAMRPPAGPGVPPSVAADPSILRAAFYGLGAATKCSRRAVERALPQVIEALRRPLSVPLKAPGNNEAHDNAVSSLVRVIATLLPAGSDGGGGGGGAAGGAGALAAAAVGGRSVLLDAVLARLPLTSDTDENIVRSRPWLRAPSFFAGFRRPDPRPPSLAHSPLLPMPNPQSPYSDPRRSPWRGTCASGCARQTQTSAAPRRRPWTWRASPRRCTPWPLCATSSE